MATRVKKHKKTRRFELETSFIMFFILFIIGAAGMIAYHEQVHVEIYRHYGIDSHVEYFSNFPTVVTVAEESTSNCDSSCRALHLLNEVVGYQIIGFTFLIVLILIIFMLEIVQIRSGLSKIAEILEKKK